MKYQIEIAGPSNESVIFNPIRKRLRGRIDSKAAATKKLFDYQRVLFSSVPVVPGLIVELDTDKKEGRIVDPLTETEPGQAILQLVNSLIAKRSIPGSQKKGWDTSTYKLKTDDVKEWAFHMRNLIDGGYAQVVPGSQTLPDSEKILATWSGKIRRDPMYNYREFNAERFPQFVHEVTDKKAATAAN